MISDSTYQYFADLIYSLSGMKYEESDFYRLEGRVNSLMKEFNCEKDTDLVQLFKGGMTKDMETFLINTSTNNETFFFRDKNPFQYVNDVFLPDLKEKGETDIRIWSAASSFGQEPLSLAMMIKKNHFNYFADLKIDASDISEKALSKCRSGVYSNLEVQRGLPIQLLMDNFSKLSDKEWKVKPELLNKINYYKFNLKSDDFPNNKYNLVFCRNVLIYQTKENKELILNKIYQALSSGGVLVMGAGESLLGMNTQFKQENSSGTVVYKKSV